ncbi:hypothetical protein VTK56DRAFT_1492 [Thermocarpiscus australiensis]
MAAVPIPGSYPLDNSLPPTPDQPVKQPVSPEQHQLSHNKLHKRNDPRGHKHTDSGVAITNPGPEQINGSTGETSEPENTEMSTRNQRVLEENLSRNFPTAIAADDSHTRNHIGPSETSGSELNKAQPPEITDQQPQILKSRDHENMQGNIGETAKAVNADRSQPASSPPAPNWGNLAGPKVPSSGIYNSVTGHGSATDDHAEHHHFSQTSAAPETSHIGGLVADYPRGGVYNTVTGHGSQGEMCKRHSDSRNDEKGNAVAASDGTDGVLAAALPENPRVTEEPAGLSTLQEGRPDHTPGLLPETMVRDDVLLAASASGDAAHRSSPHASTSPSKRAFPLATHVPGHNSGKAAGSATNHGPVAEAGGMGAGVAASDLAGEQTKNTKERDQPQPVEEDMNHQSVRETSTRKQKSGSQVEKARSHDDGSPKSEKKHRLLSIFHRHKEEGSKADDSTYKPHQKSMGDRAERRKEDAADTPNRLRKHSKGEATMERKRSPESPKTDTNRHSSDGKEKVAGGAATGAGVFGLLHGGKKEDKAGDKPLDISAPVNVDGHAGPQRDLLSGTARGAGPAEDVPRQVEEVPTPFEHPREPPLPAATTGGATDTKKDVVASEPGDYNVLLSSGTSPEARPASSQPGIKPNGGSMMQQPETYNAPAPAVASSGKRGPPVSTFKLQGDNAGSAHTARSQDGVDTEEYNVLASGTPSGVKIKPNQPRHASESATTDSEASPHHYSLSAISTPSHSDSQAPSANQQSSPGIMTYPHPEMVRNMSPEVMPEAYTASAPGHEPALETRNDVPTRENERLGADRTSSPALTAAAASWASSAGKSSGSANGAVGVGRVMHRCRYCGRDNDITEYLSRYGAKGQNGGV